MLEINKVLIGIQARSTSTRLPGKCFELIDGKPVLDHVIDVCSKSAGYLNQNAQRNRAFVKLALLIPYGDEIGTIYKHRVNIIEGDEQDVLSRYQAMATKFDADYIVRITADCPMVPEALISKHVIIAIKNNYDYVNNVHEGIRTAPDGFDCEVISRKAMEWLSDNAKSAYDREHVTTLLRSSPPNWLGKAIVMGNVDFSDQKLSVDTKEDCARVNENKSERNRKFKEALSVYGQGNIHNF